MSDQSKCIFTPTSWEDLCVFRETYLYPLLTQETAAALRQFGHWLYYMTVSQDSPKPRRAESPVRCDLRGAARDLRHLEAFLDALYSQVTGSAADKEESRLARPAGDLSDRIGDIAREIETLVGPEPEPFPAMESANDQ